MSSLIFPTGPAAWLRDSHGLGSLDAATIAAEMKTHGIAAVIPEHRLGAVRWLREEDHLHAFLIRKIRVYIGLNLDASRDLGALTASILEAIRLAKAHELCWIRLHGNPHEHTSGVVLFWGAAWKGRRTDAEEVVTRVRDQQKDAHLWCTDTPWRAPLFTLHPTTRERQWTHVNTPTQEFGFLCSQDRYARLWDDEELPKNWTEGELLLRLGWTRHASQYPTIAQRAALAPWTLRPTLPLRGRPIQDHIDLLQAEPAQILYSWRQLDNEAIVALRIFQALRALGYNGADAVQEYQNEMHRKPTGLVTETEVNELIPTLNLPTP